jgi:hypothetical protein
VELQPVTSSLLEAVNYDAEEAVLFVQFKKNKDIYSHGNIPPELFEEMIQAKSVGQFYLQTIKPFKDRFPCMKLETAVDWSVEAERSATEEFKPTLPTGDVAPCVEGSQGGGYRAQLTTGTTPDSRVERVTAWESSAAPGSPLYPPKLAGPEILAPASEDELKSAALALSNQARAIEIYTPDAYILAANTLLAIAAMRTALEKQLRGTKESPGPVRRAYDAWQIELAIFNNYDAPLADDEERLKAGMNEFSRREEAKRLAAERAARIEQERLEELAAKQRAEELQLADAIAAEERGEPEIADVIMKTTPLTLAPRYAPPVSFASNVPKIKGISHSDPWTYEITDEMKIPRKFLIPDESALKREAKLGPRASVEGVRFFNPGGVRTSRRG